MCNSESYRSDQRPTGKESYSNIMNKMFVPTKPLMKEKVTTMWSLGLVEKKYVSAHYRVLADHHTEVNSENIEGCIVHLIVCFKASEQDKNLLIYFAASETKFVKYILNDSPYTQSNRPPIKIGVYYY